MQKYIKKITLTLLLLLTITLLAIPQFSSINLSRSSSLYICEHIIRNDGFH